jgi:biopolymer transport protein ExbD
MNRMLSVCFLVVMLVAGVGILAIRQAMARAGTQADLALRKGISVQMAASSNAAPMPEADNEIAWIVTVTADGRIYFSTKQVSADGLTEQMKIHPRNRTTKLYVKADVDAPFSSVRKVLRAAHVDLFDDAILLTSQPESAQSGTTVPPKGLELWFGTEDGSNPIKVEISSEQASTTLKVNHEAVAPSELQSRLGQIFDNRAGRIVLLKVSGQMQYSQVVHAIDASPAARASRVSMTVSPEV